MPYFKWTGINLDGSLVTGKERIRSKKHLDTKLLHHDIALLAAQQIRASSFFKPIKQSVLLNFFRNLSLLLEAGIFLDYSLQLVQEQTRNKAFKEVIEDIEQEIKAGHTLSYALSCYPELFDTVTIQLLSAGQEGGNIGNALAILVTIGNLREEFYKKIRSAAALPLITLLFFFAISSVIIVVIVPLFSSMIVHTKQPIPLLTEWLLAASSLANASSFFILSLVGIIVYFFMRWLRSFTPLKNAGDYLIISFPGVSYLIKNYSLMYSFYSLSLLTKGGVPIALSLSTTNELISNAWIKEQFQKVESLVHQGHALSSALQRGDIFSPEVIAMVRIGEESGTAATMLNRAADLYKEHINRALFFISNIIQPLLMIILGVLIMLLMSAIYLPIINLSYHIT